NMSVSYRNVRDLEQRKAVFEHLFREYGDLVPDREPLWRVTTRALAEAAFWEANKAFDHRRVEDCGRYLAFAREVYPSWQYTPAWWRFRIKQLLGPTVWSGLRPLVRWLRRPSRLVSG